MGYTPSTEPAVTPQFFIENQDVTARGGTAGSGSLFAGIPFSTTAQSGSTSLTSLVSGGTLTVTATGGPSASGPWYGGLQQVSIVASGGTAVLGYTGTTSTTYTGLSLISGTGAWTIANGSQVYSQTNPIPDFQIGASTMRGAGASQLGVNDWGTLLCNTENQLAGLIPSAYGFVQCCNSIGLYGNIQWNTNTGSGAVASNVGGWSALAAAQQGTVTITAVSGSGTVVTFTATNSYEAGQQVTLASLAGGFSGMNGTQTVASATSSQFTVTNATTGATTTGSATTPAQTAPSSLLVTTAATNPGDNRVFRRVIIFFQKQTNGDAISFATTGRVVTSPTIDTNGSGIACWDSGDLGYFQLGTGFASTWHTHTSGSGGAGVLLLGALYLQSAGTNGSVNINVSQGGTTTADWLNGASTNVESMLQFFAANGMPGRRIITGDQIANDMLQGQLASAAAATVAATAQTNLVSWYSNLVTASPLSEIVGFFTWNLGTSGNPGYGASTWASTFIPAARTACITGGATFIDGYARYGDLSYGHDPWGLTADFLHMATFSASSGRSGQESLAEFLFEKLEYSKNIQISGTVQSGVATDGKIVSQVASGNALSGNAGGPITNYYANATDTQPVLQLSGQPGLIPYGMYFGPGGSTASDSGIWRLSAGFLAVKNAIRANGLTGATTATRYVGGTAGGPPATGATNLFLVGDSILTQAGQMWVCALVGTSTISACTNSSTTVTYTVSDTSKLSVGQVVSIAGITGFTTNNPNGTWTVATVPSGTTFTVTVGSAPTGSYGSGGTAGVWRNVSGGGPPTVLSPGLSINTAAQLSTTLDAMLYIRMSTAGTAFSITIGPTSTPANTIVPSITPVTTVDYVVRVPAAWYVEVISTSGVIGTQIAVTC